MFMVHRKNPISFLGVAIGRFIEINAKSSIDNYFKGAAKEVKDINIQLTKPENSVTCSNSNNESNSSLLFSEQQLNSKTSAPLSNQPLPSLNHTNNKKNKTYVSDEKNLKTTFAQLKNSNSSFTNSSTTLQNVNSKKEIKKQYKLDMNSFFTKKLEIISPIKNQVNLKLSTVDQSSSASSVEVLLESSDVISPSKNILNDNHVRTSQPPNSFFSRKLEIVSPTKQQKNDDSRIESVPIVQSFITEGTSESAPKTLLCERCNKMIDIDTYDEHIDHHVAMELNKSLNFINHVQPLNNRTLKNKPTIKKKNERGLKRKQNSKASSTNPKKPCTSISSYFKPLSNP